MIRLRLVPGLYPDRRWKIRLRDLPSLEVTEVGPGELCFLCLGTGQITRYRYPWSLGHVDGRDSHDCDLCAATGIFVRRTTRDVPRPRCKLLLYARWRDPSTGVVHARQAARKLTEGRTRPTCGVDGMRAILRARDWDFTTPITCPDCRDRMVETLERHAGMALAQPTPERVAEDLQQQEAAP